MAEKDIYILNNNAEVIDIMDKIKQKGDCILIKASNGMHFNEIVCGLNEMFSKKQLN